MRGEGESEGEGGQRERGGGGRVGGTDIDRQTDIETDRYSCLTPRQRVRRRRSMKRGGDGGSGRG